MTAALGIALSVFGFSRGARAAAVLPAEALNQKTAAAVTATRPQQLIGRAFLSPGETEGTGYQIYSYVLFSEVVNPSNRGAYEAVLGAYLGINELGVEGAGRESQDLNVVYLPLREAPPATVSTAWLLEHYDYERARLVLKLAGVDDGKKAYLVSYTSPLAPKTQVMDGNELLVEDLSDDPSRLASMLNVELSPAALPEESVRGIRRLTGRAYLPAGKTEGTRYGLYSYVLFAEPLNAGNRALYQAVLSSFLHIEEAQRFVAAGVERKDLNVTYLPLRSLPPAKPSVDWLLEHYDYIRSRIILSKIIDGEIRGAYIASYTDPLSVATSVDAGRLLLQNLSGVTADLVFLWVNEFIAQAARPRYWDKPAMRTLMLNLRSSIAVLARSFEQVRSADTDLRSFFGAKIKIRE